MATYEGRVYVEPFQEVHLRQEIDDFVEDPLQLNLFLLALEAIQVDHTNLRSSWLSYWNLAGLHNLPAVPYNEVDSDALRNFLVANNRANDEWDGPTDLGGSRAKLKNRGDQTVGYCPHSTILFLPWHRPYMVLFERVLRDKMMTIANNFPAREIAAYQEAAQTFRLPYWDPLRPRSGNAVANYGYGLPTIATIPIVIVKLPGEVNGVRTVVETFQHNPLYDYWYPTPAQLSNRDTGLANRTLKLERDNRQVEETAAENFLIELKSRSGNINPLHTVRCPVELGDNDLKPTVSCQPLVAGKVSKEQNVMREKLWRTLTRDDHADVLFETISCTGGWQLIGEPRPQVARADFFYASLEGVHDDLHFQIGGSAQAARAGVDEATRIKANGTMSEPLISAFDPMFWLLHSNIERWFCLWQCMHPDKYWNNEAGASVKLVSRTFVQAWNTKETPKTPLFPFRSMTDPANPPRAGDPVEWWTTEKIKDWVLFGYSYSGLPTRKNLTDQEKARFKAAVTAKVNRLYGWFTDNEQGLAPDYITTILEMSVVDVTNDRKSFPFYPPLLNGIGMSDRIDATAVDTTQLNIPSRKGIRGVGSSGAGGSGVGDGRVASSGTGSSGSGGAPAAGRPVIHATRLAVGDNRILPDSSREFASMNLEAAELTTAASSDEFSKPATVPPRKDTASKQPKKSGDQNNAPTQPSTNGAPTSDGQFASWTLPPHLHTDDGKLRHWDFNYVVERYALGGTFAIYIFVGDFPPEQDLWRNSPSLVLSTCVLVSGLNDSGDVQCPNCRRQRDNRSLYRDFVPLTRKLVDYCRSGERQPLNEEGMVLKSLEPEEVVPFLKRNLHWRVVSANGDEVARGDTASLRISVISTLMTFPECLTELPKFEESEYHVEVTHGRPSGLSIEHDGLMFDRAT